MVNEPDAPDAASYVINPLKRQAPEVLEKIGRYCFDLAEFKRSKNWEDIEKETELDKEAQEKLKDKGKVQQKEMVRCGKSCEGCPHGPYIFEYKWNKEKGKTESKYIGKASN